jgi:hypothetical protein
MKDLIRKILKENEIEWAEELTNTSNHQCLDSIKDKPHTGSCSVFNGKTKLLCRKLEELKYQLSDSSGLGMMKIIDDATEPIKSPVPPDQLAKFIEGLRILYRTGKFSRDYITKIKGDFDNTKLVYDDNGEWNYANKLNTNYYDLAELLTCYISDTIPASIDTILSKQPNQIVEFLKPMMQYVGQYFSPEQLKTFVRNTKMNSTVGEESEEIASKFLQDNGMVINYQGGNGDLIDMKFGVDMIVDGKLVQVKASESAVKRIRKEIDWVIVANSKCVGVYDRLNGNIVEHNGKPLYNGDCNRRISIS